MRIDQWLCNARFFKSRGLAQTAVDSGRVKVNGERSKSAATLAVGDRLSIQIGEYSWEVTVLSVTEYAHGFVPEPHELYEEDEDHLARRAQAMEAKKLQAMERAHPSAERAGRNREGRGERPGGGDRQPRGNAPGRKGRHRRKRSRGGGPDRRSGGRPG
jgi:ribosome-associated heat shock protein Hsp15